MKIRQKPTISPAQSRVLHLLRRGFVIYEDYDKEKHSLSYVTARIYSTVPLGVELPRHVHKETVFALLANGLLRSVQPWPGYDKEVFVLNEGGRIE